MRVGRRASQIHNCQSCSQVTLLVAKSATQALVVVVVEDRGEEIMGEMALVPFAGRPTSLLET